MAGDVTTLLGALFAYIGLFSILFGLLFYLWEAGADIRKADRALKQQAERKFTASNEIQQAATQDFRFKAMCECPKCGWIAYHRFTPVVERRIKTVQLDPNDPTAYTDDAGDYPPLARKYADVKVRIHGSDDKAKPRRYTNEDVETGEVIRSCSECKYEWRQR